MANAPTVGIVTVTYNSAGVIADFMASLLAQTYGDFKLYVIDNASLDDTLVQLNAYTDARIQIIANRENRGVAGGNNQGILAALQAGCRYIWLLNNDTLFEPDVLETLLNEMAMQNCDLLTHKILYAQPPPRLWAAGGYFSRWRGYASLHYGRGQPDDGQFDTGRRVDYSPTCSLLITAEVFRRIGLMDETYFIYFDDADFCWRARRAGLRLWYTPRARLWHKEGSLTGGTTSPTALRFSGRNKLYFLKKNVGVSWVLWAGLYQLYLLLRLLSRREALSIFKLRQRSFGEGVKIGARPTQSGLSGKS